MTSIPASQLVQVNPSVLSAGGSGLALNGLVLTSSPRVPIGEALAFPNDGRSVAAFFGDGTTQTDVADVYFNGFDNSAIKPQNILFTQYPATSVAAWLRSGPVGSQLTLAQLQGITGTLDVTVDGSVRSGSVDLSSASSFSAAAALIETALNDSPPTEAEVTGAIAPSTASVTASVSGYVMTVTDVLSGTVVPGAVVTGTGVTASSAVASQLSGTPGGAGTYALTQPSVVDSETLSLAYATMTVSAVASGTVSVGQTVSGTGVTATQVTALGTGEGLTGTYFLAASQTVASESLTLSGTDVTVTYDSVSAAFLLQSGVAGAASSISYGTGSAAAPLLLTQATGATLSQGAAAETPATFMDGVVSNTTNWASFMIDYDPDGGGGNAVKLEFAAWTNDQNQRFAYSASDADVTATESSDASTSLGYLVSVTHQYSGTIVNYDPNDQHIDAFVCGMMASIDFAATNGRITFAYKGQTGLVAGVTTATAAENLIANGYNFYGAYATASQQFLLYQPGQISGPFDWADSYADEIWLNSNLQLAALNLLVTVNSVPYIQAGYDLIKAALTSTIQAALNAGVIRAGVTLTSTQAAAVNAAAGVAIDTTLQNQGWYLQVLDPGGSVRQARTSPIINFWYTDGEAVQKIVISSVDVQ